VFVEPTRISLKKRSWPGTDAAPTVSHPRDEPAPLCGGAQGYASTSLLSQFPEPPQNRISAPTSPYSVNDLAAQWRLGTQE